MPKNRSEYYKKAQKIKIICDEFLKSKTKRKTILKRK